MKTIRIGSLKLGGKNTSLFFIAGPCVIENESLVLRTATKLRDISEQLKIPLIFKSSYDKANRSAGKSFRGLGFAKGLSILAKVKRETGLPILTDIHTVDECKSVAEVADVLQVPAFLCRQTDLLHAAAKTKRCVNVKKGQFMAPGDMCNVTAKIEEVGGQNILLTERGTTFGYNNLVVDYRSLPIMRKLGWPVVFDATHSVQSPGGGGTFTSGDRKMAPILARAAVAAGCDGVFFETHPQPDRAQSDAANQLPLSIISDLIKSLLDIDKVVRPINRAKSRSKRCD